MDGLPRSDCLNVQIIDMLSHDTMASVIYRELNIVSLVDNTLDVIPPLISTHPIDR